MDMIKKLLIINCLLCNSTYLFTMNRSSSQKQDQSKNLPAYVEVIINNKLPHEAAVRASYTGVKNKKEYKEYREQVARPGRSPLKIPRTILSEKIVLNLSAIESINPQTDTLVSSIPEWEISDLSYLSLIIDPKKNLATRTKDHRLTTIPEEKPEENEFGDYYSRKKITQTYRPGTMRSPRKKPSENAVKPKLATIPEETPEENNKKQRYSREEVIQAYCPDSMRTPHKEPSKKALPEGLPEGLEGFLS